MRLPAELAEKQVNTPISSSRSVSAEFILLFVAMVWGFNPVVIKIGLQWLPPQAYNLGRLVVATIVGLIALWLSGTYRRPSRADVWKLFRVSALGFFTFQVFFTEGLQRTAAGNASFIMCLLPVGVLLLNKLFGLETITRAVVLGIVCSVSGVALIVVGTGKEFSLAGHHFLGTVFVMLSQLGYAYYTVFSKEFQARYSTYQITAGLMGFTTLLLAIFALPETLSVRWFEVPAAAWGSVLFSGILALCICNFLWIWGTGVLGTSRVAIFNNVSPVFAVVSAYFVLGEEFGILQTLGAVFVFAGVYITRNRGKFEKQRRYLKSNNKDSFLK
nr:EamA family transporter [Propionivibrio soli]